LIPLPNVTYAYQPELSITPALATENSITAYWGDSRNPAPIKYNAQISTNNFATVLQSSSNIFGLQVPFAGLSSNTTHYLRVEAVNINNVPTVWTNLGTRGDIGSRADLGNHGDDHL